MSVFGGMEVVVVEAGRTFHDRGTGMVLTVHDGEMVTNGRKVWLTQSDFDALKKHTEAPT